MRDVVDKWLAAEVTIHYRDGIEGYIYGKLTDLENGIVLMEQGKSCDMWRLPEVRDAGGIWIETNRDAPPNQLMRPKWGLYRAMNATTRETTMKFADMMIIRRDKSTYVFPDGHVPVQDPIPNRDFSKYWAHETVTTSNWQTTTKSSISHNSGIVNIFAKDNLTRYDLSSNIISSGGVEGRIPIWLAADMGQTNRKVNEIAIAVNGSGVADRFASFYIAVTNSTEAWDALVSNTSSTATNPALTTLDPLGLHTETDMYYTGPNPYQFAHEWTIFAAVPEIIRNGVDKNWSTDETFNRNRGATGMVDLPQVEGRYIIWYSDPYYPSYGVRPAGNSSSSGSIQLLRWTIRYDEELDPDLAN
jgi:hypothetical protein